MWVKKVSKLHIVNKKFRAQFATVLSTDYNQEIYEKSLFYRTVVAFSDINTYNYLKVFLSGNSIARFHMLQELFLKKIDLIKLK